MPRPSSIFSFDGWRRAAALPLSVKLWIATVVATLGLVATAGIAVLQVSLGTPRGGGDRYEHVFEKGLSKGDVEIVILGDSTVDAAVLPEKLSRPAINLAVMSSGYELWNLVLQAHLKGLPKANTLILQLNPMSLLRPGLSERKGDFTDLLHLGVPALDIPRADFRLRLKNYLFHGTALTPAFGGPKLDVRGFQNLIPSAESPRHPGWGPEEGVRKKTGYIHWLQGQDSTDINLPAFRETLATARQRGIRVVFVRCPETAEFHDTGKAFWEPLQDELLEVADQILGQGNWEFLDGPKLPGFTLDLFSDPNHVTEEGAERFTQLLDAMIK